MFKQNAIKQISLLLILLVGCTEKVPAVPAASVADIVMSVATESATFAPDFTPSSVPTANPTPIPTPAPTPTEIPMMPPVICLTDGETVTVNAAFSFTDPGFFATDYLGSDLTDRVTVIGEVVSYLVGEYDLMYSVTDDFGQSVTIARKVIIQPVPMPEIVQPPEKTVYLTFDDGPSWSTEKLLDVLKKYDAKATFFVVGNRIKDDLIVRMMDEGHGVGVHSYTHVFDQIYKDEQAFFSDFQLTQQAIFERTGSYTRIFRFPGGSANTISGRNKGLMTRLTKIMEDMGYRYFDWNGSARDAENQAFTVMDYYNNIVGNIRAHSDYAIILQHDTNAQSVMAVESVLKWGIENGYTFRALDLTSPVMHSKVNN